MNCKMNSANESKRRGRRADVKSPLLPVAFCLMALTLFDRSAAEDVPPAKVPLFERMGSHQRKITTKHPEAQAYFNQGLTWLYAFNHDEAIRSFTRAAELDENCAMAWWGVSLAVGPQYNHAVMTAERTATAWGAMENALARIDNTNPVERALIEALKTRNAKTLLNEETRMAHNEAYAAAMGKIWEENQGDSDVGTLYAEALMVRRPWRLFNPDHSPHEDTPKILSVLARIMKMDPKNPGALHLKIHTIEPSGTPELGLPAADALSALVPASGHLLHMPAHIYVQTGRWEQAITQSEKAMSSDKAHRVLSADHLARHPTQQGYMTHNAHMLAYAAMMSGREKEAMAAARDMWANIDDETLQKIAPGVDRWWCSVYDVQKRFGRWDDILAEPAPPKYMSITTATWRAARAIAYAAKKDFVNARSEYEAFKHAEASVSEDYPWGRDSALKVLKVSDRFILGEIALQNDDWGTASELLEEAAKFEDALSYGEPPQWLQPVRHTLGAVYLKRGRFKDAERMYREDLAKWPDNGWSLYGLSRALTGQGKAEEAEKAMAEHLRIWTKADGPITTSCECIPET
jgi:tetratricopeptide (TPR) repeat protein